jgi:peptidoglycan/LPS O-acetylase OafA/YrhL
LRVDEFLPAVGRTCREIQGDRKSAGVFFRRSRSTLRLAAVSADAGSDIRGLAVLLVLLDHASDNKRLLPGADLNRLGKYVVYLFFVLSAFLLTSQLYDSDVDLFPVPPIFRLLAFFGTVLAVASASYFLLERPLQKIRVRRPSATRLTPAPAASLTL